MKTINRKIDKGFALISALVVLAIVTGATVAMVVKQTNGIEIASNIIRYNQASNHADGIYLWAEGILIDDIKGNLADSFEDGWNQRLDGVEIEGGEIDARIIDLQSRFNINNLGLTGSSGDLARERFRRLLYTLDITTDFTDAVADWIDADSETRFPNGAEDVYYLGQEGKSYRTANQRFSSIDELLLVKGVSLLSFEKLRPYISALDIGVGININTASKQVLASLSNQMNGSAIDEVVQIREQDVIVQLEQNSTVSSGDISDSGDFRELLTGNKKCDLVIADVINKDPACINARDASKVAQFKTNCEIQIESAKQKCTLLSNGGGTSKGISNQSTINLADTGFQSKYNVKSDGLSVNSGYFDVFGKVQYINESFVINYRLRRDPDTGQIQLVSKKINGIKEIKEDEGGN